MHEVEKLGAALVTGASGFIGQHLCRALQADGVRVRAMLRTPVSGPWDEHCIGDLCAASLSDGLLSGLDTVFHLAGRAHALSESSADISAYTAVNVDGTRRLLAAASAAGVSRFIFFSSVKAMGEGGARCLNEASLAVPVHPYGETKLQAENLVREAAALTGLHGVILRLPLLYGGSVKGNLARMLRAIDRGRFPPLPEVGNKRSMIHVLDVVSAALLVSRASSAAGKTYLLTDGEAYSSRALYELMCRALGRRVPRWSLPMSALRVAARLGDLGGAIRGRRLRFDSEALSKLTGSAWYDSALIAAELGFQAVHRFEESLPEMVDAIRRAG